MTSFNLFSTLRLVDRLSLNHYTQVLLPHGLNVNQWGLLRYLVENGETTFSEAAAAWHLENPTLTPIAQKLIEKNFIAIEIGTDRRQKLMKVTEQGKKQYEQIKSIVAMQLDEMLEGVTVDEQNQFLDILERMYLNIMKRGI